MDGANCLYAFTFSYLTIKRYQRRFQSSLISILHPNENCHHVVAVSTPSKHIETHQFPNSKSKNRKSPKPSPSPIVQNFFNQPKTKKKPTENPPPKKKQRFFHVDLPLAHRTCRSRFLATNHPKWPLWTPMDQGDPPKKGEEITWLGTTFEQNCPGFHDFLRVTS